MDKSQTDKIIELVMDAIESWPEFDTDEPISGSDLVEWFGNWRERAQAIVIPIP